jgi:metal-responsive CopG/Arc/MetJ family transcriptional regulator
MPVRKALSTIALPNNLLEAIDTEIRQGHARSREEFLEAAIMNQVAALHHVSVDRQFAAMATDSAYLKEALQISEEFSAADWEALQSEERSF